MSSQRDSKTVRDRFAMQFLNETRRCFFREDVPEITIGGEKLGPFKAETAAQLPNWAIEKLTVYDFVDLDVSDTYDSFRSFQNLYNTEREDPKLQSLYDKKNERPKLLYSALIRKMSQLQSDKTSMEPRRYADIKKMSTMLRILTETRLSKLIRAAKPESGVSQDNRKRMSREERWLADELYSLLSAWREMVREKTIV
ncbi:MAG: hypothetical protein ACFFAX_00805 [Promethearchaeota archaeon]